MDNTTCEKCIADFTKEGIPFNPRMCNYCQYGQELHRLEMMESQAEQEWGKCDWTSSRFKDFYHG